LVLNGWLDSSLAAAFEGVAARPVGFEAHAVVQAKVKSQQTMEDREKAVSVIVMSG
jgi:hypothetical protein